MAEQVQETLDKMVPSLYEYIEKNIFTTDEIHCIISRRRQSEYLLHRSSNVRKEDYIHYIQQEIQFESLRALRTKRMVREQKEKDRLKRKIQQQNGDDEPNHHEDDKKNKKKSLSYCDYHIVSHIHILFQRLLYKYKSDVTLYIQYIQFCYHHQSYRQLSKIYGQCLQYHPTNIPIWIEAASYEYFHHTHSIHKARIILHRAIRMNSSSSSSSTTTKNGKQAYELWIQLFALELHFVQKLQGRKQILLGSSGTTGKRNEKKNQDDDDDDNNEKEKNTDDDNNNMEMAHLLPDGTVGEDDPDDPHKIARIVYNNALKSIGGGGGNSDITTSNNSSNKKDTDTDCIQLALQFMDQCQLFPSTQTLQKYIMNHIQTYYSNHAPEAYIAMAMYYYEQYNNNHNQQNNEKPPLQKQESGKTKQQPTGFLKTRTDNKTNVHEEEDEEKDEENNIDDTTMAKKKRKGNDDDDDEVDVVLEHDDSATTITTTTVENNDPVITTIQDGFQTIGTSDMYVQGIRFLMSYLDDVVNGSNNNHHQTHKKKNHIGGAVHKVTSIVKCLDDTFEKKFFTYHGTNNNKKNNKKKEKDEYDYYFHSVDLVLEHIKYIQQKIHYNTNENNMTNTTKCDMIHHAIEIIQKFILSYNNNRSSNNNGSGGGSVGLKDTTLPAILYIKWVDLILIQSTFLSKQDSSKSGTSHYKDIIQVYKNALRTYEVQDSNYMILLLQLFTTIVSMLDRTSNTELSQLKGSNNDDNDSEEEDDDDHSVQKELVSLFQQFILLAPGYLSKNRTNHDVVLDQIDETMIMVVSDDYKQTGSIRLMKSIPSVMLLYLQYLIKIRNVHSIRMVYDEVIFKSTFMERILQYPDYHPIMKLFIDESINFEKVTIGNKNNSSNNSCIKRIKRLYEQTIKIFTPLTNHKYYNEYKERRNNDVLYGSKNHLGRPSHSIVTNDNGPRNTQKTHRIPTFDVSKADFDPTIMLNTYNEIQVVHLTNVAASKSRQQKIGEIISYSDVASIFKKLNKDDKVSWCVETNGSNATTAILNANSDSEQCRAYCSFLIQKDKKTYDEVLNRLPFDHFTWKETSEWNYETALWIFFGRNPLGNPNLPGRAEHTDAVSHDGTWHYQLSGIKRWLLRPSEEMKHQLRKLRTNSTFLFDEESDKQLQIDCKEGDVIIVNTRLWFHQTIIPPQRNPSVSYARDFRVTESTVDEGEGGMMNLDGLYAVTSIDANTIIFREDDMPECELHTSQDPNCEVVELEDGTSAVISIRSIMQGDFFCVPEDSSAESSSDDDS